jgi:hypothetical protein
VFESVTQESSFWEGLTRFYRSNPPWKSLFVTAAFLNLGVAFSCVAATIFTSGSDSQLPSWATVEAEWIPLSFAVAIGAWIIVRRKKELTASQALAEDSRRPILYLRPFKADTSRVISAHPLDLFIAVLSICIFATLGSPAIPPSFLKRQSNLRRAEELIVDPLKDLGPVIAIGRPGTRKNPVGAARLQVDDGDWQAVVGSLMDRSQLIVKYAGTTPGFRWEIERTFRSKTFVPTLIFLPLHASEKMLHDFARIMKEAAGFDFSEPLKLYRLLYFPRADRVQMVKDGDSESQRSLAEMNPFLPSLAQIMDKIRPGWSAIYSAQAISDRRSRLRSRLRFMGITAIMVSAFFLRACSK